MSLIDKTPFSELLLDGVRNGLYKSKEFMGRGMPVVKMGHLYNNRILTSGLSGFDLFDVNSSEQARFSLTPNDLLFARTSVVPEGVGLCSFVQEISQATLFESNIIRARVDNARCNPKYLFYYFQSPAGRGDMLSIANGAAIRTIRGSDLINLFIPTPARAIQDKIVAILSAYDDLIDNNRKRIALLEKGARLLYEEWFVRLRFPGHEHTPVVDGVPEGWEKAFLPEIVDINPRTKVAADGEKWFVEMACLSNSSMVIDEPVLKEGNSGSKFKNHDTLLARITPCLENGKTGYVNFLKEEESGFGSTEFIVLRGKKVPPQFVYCLARAEHFRRTAIKSMVGSSGRQRVQTAALEDYELLLPKKALLDAFETTVKPAFEAVRVLSAQNQKLQQARDLLLPRLMSGELAV